MKPLSLATIAGPVQPLVFRDGEVLPAGDATVSALDRTLLYGMGAFETVRLYRGRPFVLPRHLRRLERSLGAVGLPVPAGVADLAAGLPELAARNGVTEALCRVTVTAGAEGAAPGDPAAAGRVLAFLRVLDPWPAGRRVEVGIADAAADTASPLTGIKSTNYLLHYILRDRAHRAGRVDDLMVDDGGHVTEASVSNVFAVRGGGLVTPPLALGILPGITRGLVMELARERDLACAEAPLTVDDLKGADECFLTSSAKGVQSVDALDGRTFDDHRPVTAALAEAFAALVRRECG